MGHQQRDDNGIIFAALRSMDGHGVGQLQLLQAVQRILGIPSIKVDDDSIGPDLTNKACIAVKYAFPNDVALTVIQNHLAVVFQLDHPVAQTEYSAAIRHFRFALHFGIDLLPDHLVQILGGCLAVFAVGGQDLKLLDTYSGRFLFVDTADSFRCFLLVSGRNKNEV